MKHSKYGMSAKKIAAIPAKYHYDILLQQFAKYLTENGLESATFSAQWSEGHTRWEFSGINFIVSMGSNGPTINERA